MFLLYIWDLQIPDIGDPKYHQQIFKYVDDTKLLAKTSSQDQSINIQNSLDHIYKWQEINNMKFNGSKFVRISVGPSEDTKSIPLFTPHSEDIIEQKEHTKDLGVLVDDCINYKAQRLKVLRKVKNKSAWILRTFTNRDPRIMKTLWHSLIQPIQDYGSLIWAPIMEVGDLMDQESPLRQFTKRVKGFEGLNYWQ